MFTIFSTTGCSSHEAPPFFTASVIDLYGNKSIVENFQLVYSWQERGETPFLKPYTINSIELIAEIVIPSKDDPNKISIKTERIPFQDIHKFNIFLAGSGKKIRINKINGDEIIARINFPRTLLKGEKTGLADSSIFVKGMSACNKERNKYSLDFNFIKQVKFDDFAKSHQ